MGAFWDSCKESNVFLNLILDNIDAAVLLADEKMNVRQFNHSFVNLFHSGGEDFKSFGQAASCIHCVQERAACGGASGCRTCAIRKAMIQTLVKKRPANNLRTVQDFHINGKRESKHLRFSTRPVCFEGRDMVMLIIHDDTAFELQRLALEQRQRQVDQDLASAAGIQQGLLPPPDFCIPGLDFSWKFVPCNQIGGDILNIHDLGQGKVCLYILDAAGHGISAALISVAVSHFLVAGPGLLQGPQGPTPPAQVLQRLSEVFPFDDSGNFFSIIYMLVDIPKGKLTCSCAGHPPAFLLRGERLRKVKQREPAIGLKRNHQYGQKTMKLQKGDKIILYTDGAIECQDPAGDLFGEARFMDSLVRHGRLPLKQLLDQSFSDISRYAQGVSFNDDISLCALHFKAKP